ncbi:MAG: monovalent cation:proton antiporter-2 (CPA2) family protein [Pseudomonadota bacterium]
MSFLAETLIFLTAALIVVPLCKRLGLSSVLGYLAAGVLVGPSGFGLIGEAVEILHFAEIGVVLLLFIIGLELRPRRLWVMRRAVFGLGSAQVFATTVAIGAFGYVALGLTWQAALLVGFALALSSTAFVLQLLGEQRTLNHPHGRAAFGVLLLQDIAVIPALLLLNFFAPSDNGANPEWWVVVLTLGGFVAARFALRPVLRSIAATGIHELFVAAGLALVLGAALAMQAAGLSMGLGAFIAGMMVADSEYRHQLEVDVEPFKGLLLGLFFIAVGMSANLAVLADIPVLVVGLALALVVLKLAVLYPLAIWHKLESAERWRTSVVLAQGGEFAFVLLTAGVGSAVLDRQVLEIGVVVITLSMVSTPLLVSLLERWLTRGDDRPFDTIEAADNPVVIAGFGRFAQIVARILSMRQIPFTTLEANPAQVDFVREFGNEVHYGDATRLDLLQAANVAEARALVIAIDDIEASVRVAMMVHETCPGVAILARAHNRQHEIALREIGVTYVIRDTLSSSLELATELLGVLGDDPKTASDAVAAFRVHDAETLERQRAVSHDPDAFRQTTRDAAEELRSLFSDDARSTERE